jgi:hypothetical protein
MTAEYGKGEQERSTRMGFHQADLTSNEDLCIRLKLPGQCHLDEPGMEASTEAAVGKTITQLRRPTSVLKHARRRDQ